MTLPSQSATRCPQLDNADYLHLVVPLPCLGINRFAHAAQNPKDFLDVVVTNSFP
ncbi:MAG: hypothetical protein Ct9H300mP8_06680 [Gammaproteobacteria bacterium]|nr:MAG: hypothetical protein Ct9H300mP8_06680 [Gammaproteobacteria bacterium]